MQDAQARPDNLSRIEWRHPRQLPPGVGWAGPGRDLRAAQDAAAPCHFLTGETPLSIIKRSRTIHLPWQAGYTAGLAGQEAPQYSLGRVAA